jgi:hypothetical protein
MGDGQFSDMTIPLRHQSIGSLGKSNQMCAYYADLASFVNKGNGVQVVGVACETEVLPIHSIVALPQNGNPDSQNLKIWIPDKGVRG